MDGAAPEADIIFPFVTPVNLGRLDGLSAAIEKLVVALLVSVVVPWHLE